MDLQKHHCALIGPTVVTWTNQMQERLGDYFQKVPTDQSERMPELLTNEKGAVSERLSKLKLARENLTQ